MHAMGDMMDVGDLHVQKWGTILCTSLCSKKIELVDPTSFCCQVVSADGLATWTGFKKDYLWAKGQAALAFHRKT
jgi:hypothetical protein